MATVKEQAASTRVALKLVSVGSEFSTASREKRGRDNSFSRRLRELWEASGLKQADLAEALTAELAPYGVTVSQVNMSNWITGTVPRPGPLVSVGRKRMPRADLILQTAERLTERERRNRGGPRAIHGTEVARYLAELHAEGIPPRNLQIATELSPSLYRAWASGAVSVSRARWALFRHKVETYRAFLRESQDVFKAENEFRNIKSEARRRGMTVLQWLLQREIDQDSKGTAPPNVFKELEAYRIEATTLGISLHELVLAKGVLAAETLARLQTRAS